MVTFGLVENVLLALEKLIPGNKIAWELKHSIKEKPIENGNTTEAHAYKNVSLGEDRPSKLEQKYIGKKGDMTFWNGELKRIIKIRLVVGRRILLGDDQPTFLGYYFEITLSRHVAEYETAFKTIAQTANAQFADLNFFSAAFNSLMMLNAALQHDFKQYPNHIMILQDMASHLPHLKGPYYRTNSKTVTRLLWLNYWDAETAAYYGFPNPELDARLMPLAEQLPNGGWMFKLTEEPLDLQREDHREAVIWAYNRFKPIGLTVEDYEHVFPPKPPTPAPTAEEFLAKAEASLKDLPPEERKQAESNLANFKDVLNKLGKTNLKK